MVIRRLNEFVLLLKHLVEAQKLQIIKVFISFCNFSGILNGEKIDYLKN